MFTKLTTCFNGEEFLREEQVALLFIGNMVRYSGIPISIIYDRDLRFTSDFW